MAAHVLDFNQPDSAKAVGTESATAVQALVVRLQGPAIVDLATLNDAVQARQHIADMTAKVTAFFAPLKQMAHKLHKTLCDREREILAPLERLDALKRTAIGDYKREQDRIRQAEEQRLAEERHRLEQDLAAAEAARLEAAGEPEVAQAVLAEAIAAPPPVVALADITRQVSGLKFRTAWKWRYVGGPRDLADTPPAIRARAMQLIPREYLAIDEQKIGAVVRSLKATARIPGIEVYSVEEPVR